MTWLVLKVWEILETLDLIQTKWTATISLVVRVLRCWEVVITNNNNSSSSNSNHNNPLVETIILSIISSLANRKCQVQVQVNTTNIITDLVDLSMVSFHLDMVPGAQVVQVAILLVLEDNLVTT